MSDTLMALGVIFSYGIVGLAFIYALAFLLEKISDYFGKRHKDK